MQNFKVLGFNSVIEILGPSGILGKCFFKNSIIRKANCNI